MATKKTTLLTNPEIIDPHYKKLRKQLNLVKYEAVTAYTVKSIATLEDATALRTEITNKLAELEVDRQELIVPLRAVLDGLYARHRAVKEPLETADSVIRQAITKYVNAQSAKKQISAEKKAKKQGFKGSAIKEAVLQAKLQPATSATVKERNVWVYEVLDGAKVPAFVDGFELREIKQSWLLKAIRKTSGKIKIPGIVSRLEKQITR